MYIDNPDIPQFLSPDVQKAVGIDAATFRNWIVRKPAAILLSEDDRLAGGSGRSHLLTYRRTLQTAITAHLVRLGLSPRQAGLAAAKFTDMGSAVSGAAGQIGPFKRGPGQLFNGGATLLVVQADEGAAEIVHATPQTTAASLFYGRKPALAIAHINRIDEDLKATLGIHPNWGLSWQIAPADAHIKIPN